MLQIAISRGSTAYSHNGASGIGMARPAGGKWAFTQLEMLRNAAAALRAYLPWIAPAGLFAGGNVGDVDSNWIRHLSQRWRVKAA